MEQTDTRLYTIRKDQIELEIEVQLQPDMGAYYDNIENISLDLRRQPINLSINQLSNLILAMEEAKKVLAIMGLSVNE